MILRVWAMYNQSRIVLGALLVSRLGGIVPGTFACIVYSDSESFQVGKSLYQQL